MSLTSLSLSLFPSLLLTLSPGSVSHESGWMSNQEFLPSFFLFLLSPFFFGFFITVQKVTCSFFLSFLLSLFFFFLSFFFSSFSFPFSSLLFYIPSIPHFDPLVFQSIIFLHKRRSLNDIKRNREVNVKFGLQCERREGDMKTEKEKLTKRDSNPQTMRLKLT